MAQPNVILIVADQHRWDCTGYAGNPDIRTPNLDALAAHGVWFTQAICPYPLSSPSRASMLTGQYPATHGVRVNNGSLGHDALTLPILLRSAGYLTGCVGKVHLDAPRTSLGFDVLRLAEQEGSGRDTDDYHAMLAEQGLVDEVDHWDQVDRASAPAAYWDSFGAIPSTLPEGLHSTTWIGNMAVRFIQSAVEPFFLMVSFIKPHHPFDPPAPWDQLYNPAELHLPGGWRLPPPEQDVRHGGFFDPAQMTEEKYRRILAYYYASISHLDHQIGRILATLTSHGFTNNLFVYTADHGDYMGQHGLVLKHGALPYDSLLRVPLVIAGLAGQRRAQADPVMAELVDVAPTVLEAAGVDIPGCMEGRSLAPLLETEGLPHRTEGFCEGAQGQFIVRGARYKLIESDNPELCAFYDLKKDPHEFQNLYDVCRDKERLTIMQNALAIAKNRRGVANPTVMDEQ